MKNPNQHLKIQVRRPNPFWSLSPTVFILSLLIFGFSYFIYQKRFITFVYNKKSQITKSLNSSKRTNQLKIEIPIQTENKVFSVELGKKIKPNQRFGEPIKAVSGQNKKESLQDKKSKVHQKRDIASLNLESDLSDQEMIRNDNLTNEEDAANKMIENETSDSY
jgi:hypothetical protein